MWTYLFKAEANYTVPCSISVKCDTDSDETAFASFMIKRIATA